MSEPKVILKRSDRPALTLAVAFALVAAPATISTAWHYFTGDSGGRPLAITREYLAITRENEPLNGIAREDAIVAVIDWGESGPQQFTRRDLKYRLERTFYGHGEEVIVVFRNHSGSETSITYEIGNSKFGPAPLSGAARYVRPSIDALRLQRR